MNKTFNRTFSNYQKQINKEIEGFFNKKINQTKNRPFLKRILRLLKQFSLRPAGRIRAILVNQGYFSAGGKNKKAILKTSIFIELTHNYLLIHDDIIDSDNFRRGTATLHRAEGLAMAIELGDMMATLGYEVLFSSNFPGKDKNRALDKLNQIIYSTAWGQMLELNLRDKIKRRKQIKEQDIFEIYRSKTAPYSFIGPLQIGAILAGANENFLKKIEKFALPLGVAFQITDDISDASQDAKEDQPTIVRKSGSIQYSLKKAENLIKKAKKTLKNERNFPQKEKEFLLNLADSLLTR